MGFIIRDRIHKNLRIFRIKMNIDSKRRFSYRMLFLLNSFILLLSTVFIVHLNLYFYSKITVNYANFIRRRRRYSLYFLFPLCYFWIKFFSNTRLFAWSNFFWIIYGFRICNLLLSAFNLIFLQFGYFGIITTSAYPPYFFFQLVSSSSFS